MLFARTAILAAKGARATPAMADAAAGATATPAYQDLSDDPGAMPG
jgi:hypothetical protein